MNFEGYFSDHSRGKLIVNLNMVEFVQDTVHILYAPAIEIYGYGKTNEEARASFITCMEEFLTYTNAKGTFIPELKRLGWKIKGRSQKTFRIPDFSDLLKNNKRLIDILNTKEVRTYHEEIPLPIQA
jgi:hypothetical protein